MCPVKQSLYICSTYYHVYITLLKCMVLQEKIDVVVCDDIPTGRELCERLQRSGLFGHAWYVAQSKLPREWGKNLIDWVFFQKKRRLKAIVPLLPFCVWDYKDVYIFHDGTPLGMHLIDARKPYHLIEDSIDFYQRFDDTPQAIFLKRHTLKYRLRKWVGWGYFSLGDSPLTIDVEVNKNENLQLTTIPVVELPRKEMVDKLSAEDKHRLLSLFGVTQCPISLENTALLLTEPLYNDKVCPSQKVQFLKYKQIVGDLKKQGYRVIIKPHPRDTVEYSGLSVPVLEQTFPVELLNCWLQGEFECVAAVSSTAVFSVRAKRIKMYDKILEEKGNDHEQKI